MSMRVEPSGSRNVTIIGDRDYTVRAEYVAHYQSAIRVEFADIPDLIAALQKRLDEQRQKP